ncbi:hypothetical protein SSX86_001908 [Deinandra increscens subsp. villosa]|uniref:F-box protein Hrt3/FBXO9 C-terminal domain-containing protein n=1 Tax=Deinandra increscens subsp. villosa TaxID=3103831 RepID=A0AAP0HD44_9ASTR
MVACLAILEEFPKFDIMGRPPDRWVLSMEIDGTIDFHRNHIRRHLNQLEAENVEGALLYPGMRPTIWRIRLRLRGTTAGANNRMDLLSIVTSGVQESEVPGPNGDILGVVEGWQDDETHNPDVPAISHTRGLTPFVFVPFEEVETSVLNLPVERMDYYVPG